MDSCVVDNEFNNRMCGTTWWLGVETNSRRGGGPGGMSSVSGQVLVMDQQL